MKQLTISLSLDNGPTLGGNRYLSVGYTSSDALRATLQAALAAKKPGASLFIRGGEGCTVEELVSSTKELLSELHLDRPIEVQPPREVFNPRLGRMAALPLSVRVALWGGSRSFGVENLKDIFSEEMVALVNAANV